MTFGEKLRMARIDRKLTQKELASLSGIALRSIQNWEAGERTPKSRDAYDSLARILNVEVNDLMNDDAEFVLDARERYGARGERQARALIEQVTNLYAGGELAEEDMDAMNRALQEAYWMAKDINRKFVPKKYRKDGDESGGSSSMS